ncbi:MAG: hypothetical protein ACI83B_001422, partial [Sediminicola sp.]
MYIDREHLHFENLLKMPKLASIMMNEIEFFY